VDTHHSDADGPGSLADTEAEVAVIGVDVTALLECVDNLDDGIEEGVLELARLEFPEELAIWLVRVAPTSLWEESRIRYLPVSCSPLFGP
jgi:hypothetical protein